jgi:hypothetical protein
MQTVRRQKANPYRTDSSAFLLPDLQLCSFSQHSALQSALLRRIKPMTLSVSRSYKHRPSVSRSYKHRPSVSLSYKHPTFSVTFLQTSDLQCHVPTNIDLQCHVPTNIDLQCHVPTNIDLLLCTKAVQLLRRSFTARASGRAPFASCRNRGAATAVPTVCSEHALILHHISAFICYVYLFLMSVAVDSVYKQYGSDIVPLLHLTSCYTLSTIYKYRLYQINYKYLCTLNIKKLSLNISIKYCYHN